LAKTLILDSSDTVDWVRVKYDGYPKYQDTTIQPIGLIKFRTSDIPNGSSIKSAFLYFYVHASKPGALITASYSSDDSWSNSNSDPQDLYNWPVDFEIDSYQSGNLGWKAMDITQALACDTNHEISIKITPDDYYFFDERIASPSFYAGHLRPYIQVNYSSRLRDNPDLTSFDSSIEMNPVWAKPGSLVALSATIRNIGSSPARNVKVEFYGGEPGRGVLLSRHIVPIG
jgi:hypothetical protein